MRYLVGIAAVMFVFFVQFGVIFAQFEGVSIPLLSTAEISPPVGGMHPHIGELPIADTLPRVALSFDFPHDLFSSTTAIVEAFLRVKLVPVLSGLSAEPRPFEVYLVPKIEGHITDWERISPDVFKYAVGGVYDPSTGEVFFEISPLLRAIRDGDVSARGFMLVPGRDAPPFRLAPEHDAISLKCEYRPGKKKPETEE